MKVFYKDYAIESKLIGVGGLIKKSQFKILQVFLTLLHPILHDSPKLRPPPKRPDNLRHLLITIQNFISFFRKSIPIFV